MKKFSLLVGIFFFSFLLLNILYAYSSDILVEAENETSYKVITPPPNTSAFMWRSRKLANLPGFSGTGYWYLSRGGDRLYYNVYIPETGTYNFIIRDYRDLRHSAGARTVIISVDGIDKLSTHPGNIKGWNLHSAGTIYLTQGSHTISIKKATTTSGAAIIDYFILRK